MFVLYAKEWYIMQKVFFLSDRTFNTSIGKHIPGHCVDEFYGLSIVVLMDLIYANIPKSKILM